MNKSVVSILVLAMSAPAFAQQMQMEASASSPSSELSSLQAQIPVLEAQARIAKLKAEIKNPAGAGAGAPAPGGMLGASVDSRFQLHPQPTGPVRKAVVADHSAPELVEITGYNGHLQAKLQINGTRVSVSQGSVIHGGWIVTKLTPSMIELRRGNRVSILTL